MMKKLYENFRLLEPGEGGEFGVGFLGHFWGVFP